MNPAACQILKNSTSIFICPYALSCVKDSVEALSQHLATIDAFPWDQRKEVAFGRSEWFACQVRLDANANTEYVDNSIHLLLPCMVQVSTHMPFHRLGVCWGSWNISWQEQKGSLPPPPPSSPVGLPSRHGWRGSRVLPTTAQPNTLEV